MAESCGSHLVDVFKTQNHRLTVIYTKFKLHVDQEIVCIWFAIM